jgi:exodeoxyribonuclease-3
MGLGDPTFDVEGRVIIAEYEKFFLINSYFPSGSRDRSRVDYKLLFNNAFLEVVETYRAQKPIVFCGDVNTAHQPIDLTHAKANEKNSGFLPEERAWIDKIVGMGYVDTFRHFYPDKAEIYSWWTARGAARAKNVGWRIDYFFATEELLPALVDAAILMDVMGSDHCPVVLEMDLSRI